MDSDAIPQRWRHVRPKEFIEGQAHALGISSTQIGKMSQINSIFTDGSETIWAFWYRIARMKEAYMWTNHLAGGTLIVEKLGYSLGPSYFLGDPPKGQPRNLWIQVEAITQTATKQGRKRKVIIYGATAKKGKVPGKALVSQAIDTAIRDWKKQPISVLTSTVDKTADDLHKRAGAEVFEAIVGAIEWQLTIRDTGQLIQQNKMCRINMPHYMPPGNYFVVGVTRQGSPQGMTQIVRVREKGFALSKRVPDAPVLAKTPTSVSDEYKSAANITAQLKGVRWGDSFVRATREYGTANGWDFSLFLGVLMSICRVESNFHNEREIHTSADSNIEWYAKPTGDGGSDVPAVHAQTPGQPAITVKPTVPSLSKEIDRWHELFANNPGNPDNPFRGRWIRERRGWPYAAHRHSDQGVR